jgi:hypothetical protein
LAYWLSVGLTILWHCQWPSQRLLLLHHLWLHNHHLRLAVNNLLLVRRTAENRRTVRHDAWLGIHGLAISHLLLLDSSHHPAYPARTILNAGPKISTWRAK